MTEILPLAAGLPGQEWRDRLAPERGNQISVDRLRLGIWLGIDRLRRPAKDERIGI